VPSVKKSASTQWAVKQAAQDDDDDDEAAAGASGGKGALSPEEMNQKVKDLVRLALFCERKTQTIKRDEISKQVLKEAPKAFPVVFARANEELRDVFGFEMVPIDARERAPAALSGAVSTKKAKPATARQYILKNLLLPPEDSAKILLFTTGSKMIKKNNQTSSTGKDSCRRSACSKPSSRSCS